ncbi:MAG: effector binding domain-containing protein [Firmicutes bacterium]|nr:effector binding domain-containing protein [Bacillota bacterium]
MEQLITISQLSKEFNVTTRMLRHYEKMGLINSLRTEDYAYRVYDRQTMIRLQQIIVLRKLRISLKDIGLIFENPDVTTALDVFMQGVNEINDEITALETMRSILSRFIAMLKESSDVSLQKVLLSDEIVRGTLNTLSITKFNFKEDKLMDDLKQASEKMTKLSDADVRIVYIPPMTFAAYTASGENCESKAGDAIDQFVKDTGLLDFKPDARSFGFDCSDECQGPGMPSQHYQVWVSIPDDMEIPDNLKKIHFCGGNYAAHVLMNWDFEMWRYLCEWVGASEKYDFNSSKDYPGFEERLNYYHIIKNGCELQLDLLFPIKMKE